jgi:hypothetical protein
MVLYQEDIETVHQECNQLLQEVYVIEQQVWVHLWGVVLETIQQVVLWVLHIFQLLQLLFILWEQQVFLQVVG